MKRYDVVVIGSGCGMNVVEEAVGHGLRVALLEKGPMGGTCLNLGCIPSKMLIFTADRVQEIRESPKLSIDAELTKVDFKSIMERMRKLVRESQNEMRHNISHIKKMDLYEGAGRFVDEYTLEVNGQKIKGEKIFIASGSRPLVPPIKGLESAAYLNNETLLKLDEKPESLIIIGGGYIAVEYGHFFAAMGTEVTILEMADRLVLAEEPEISELLKKELSRRMDVFTGFQAEEVKTNGHGVTVIVKDNKSGLNKEISAEKIMVAVGRRSNADLLDLEKTGIETDKRGFIKADKYMETNRKNIFAIGDINGEQMFTHAANREAQIAVDNAIHDSKVEFDSTAAPHAVYSRPQIASVGLTEANARKDHKVIIGRGKYSDVAQGLAMKEENGFAKAILEEKSRKILGFHIIGPYAPMLIQEVINAMASGGGIDHLESGMHIHPALPELILTTLSNMEES